MNDCIVSIDSEGLRIESSNQTYIQDSCEEKLKVLYHFPTLIGGAYRVYADAIVEKNDDGLLITSKFCDRTIFMKVSNNKITEIRVVY